jgi:type IV pilus assembly protein PilW
MTSLVRNEFGHSLIELMFGLGIALAAVSAAYTVASTTDKASVVNDQTAQMQQNARIAMELMASDVRMAGFGMNSAVGACTQPIMPVDHTPTGADRGPDAVSLVIPVTLSTLSANTAAPFNSIALQPGAVAAMSPSGFGTGASLSIGGATPATVTGIAGDVLTLGASVALPVFYPANTQVFWLQCVTYSVGTTTAACAGGAPCLLRNGVAVVEGIEDIQLAYACDGCNLATNGGVADGIIDDQNGSNTFDTADFISDNTWTTAPLTPDKFRLVRISLVARQSRNDREWHGTAPTTVEDHDPTTDTGFSLTNYQQARRRVLTRVVQVRNLGL